MKQSAFQVLDDRDLEFMEVLRSLNVPRSVAMMITYLANVEEATSREIQVGTGLNQPEVSIGMRTFYKNKWIIEREVKPEGKGRPMKVYKLSIPIDKILEHYEGEKRIESTQFKETIQKLRDLIVA